VFNKFFFRLSIHALVAKIWPNKIVRWCRDGNFLHPVFSEYNPVVLKASTKLMPTNLVRIYSLLRYSLVSCFVDDDSSSVPTFGGMSRAKRKPVFKKGMFDDTHCRDVLI